jgi:uncharacterized protein YndB with AHSA1/START domain
MNEGPKIVIARQLKAPRTLVYRAFTDPDHLALWWGPLGNVLPRDEMDFDVRPGGHLRWTELSPLQPGLRVRVEFALTAVEDCKLLDGVMRVARRQQDAVESFASRILVQFHDACADQTRLEIRQWLPADFARRAELGWSQAVGKLEKALSTVQNSAVR